MKFVLPLFLAVALSACATDRAFGEADSIEVTDLDTLPEPRGEIFYSIGPQETLEVVVVGSEDLSGKYLTDVDGNVLFPYLGMVETGSKSPQEAARLIANGLKGRIILDPQVRVIPEDFPEPSISIGGQVKRPGSYPALGRPTLLRLVNQAEGLAEYAKRDDVLILRSVEGQRYIGLYSLAAIERGNYPDPRLYPNDIVMVGDSPGDRRLDNILQFAPLVTSAVILLDRVGR
ncbi:MAG: polysaccharide biosynthesis/export family protein [Parvularcula sp.]|nr:polysaccharide biosynthesis/export family protein [Parvularcula sp.]